MAGSVQMQYLEYEVYLKIFFQKDLPHNCNICKILPQLKAESVPSNTNDYSTKSLMTIAATTKH